MVELGFISYPIIWMEVRFPFCTQTWAPLTASGYYNILVLVICFTCEIEYNFFYLFSSGSCRRLTLHQLLESNFPAISSSSKLSREELLMWERKRQAPSWGISSYELHADTGKLIFPAASNLFQCVDTGFSVSNTFSSVPSIPLLYLLGERKGNIFFSGFTEQPSVSYRD